MSDTKLKKYKGNCHCGAFRFELTLTEIETVIVCNCSICAKKGYLLVLATADQFRIISGENILSSYEFGAKAMRHKFCPTCGTGVIVTHSTSLFRENISVNARTLVDVNSFSLKIVNVDGQSNGLFRYVPSPFTGKIPEIEVSNVKVYTGSCHCGAVTLAVRTKPLSEVEIKEDNCSICQRNANICIYPNRSRVTIVGAENTTEYLFGRRFTGHHFCKICGVPIYMQIHGPPKAVFDSWPEARKTIVRRNLEILPVRIGVLNDVEWDQLKVERSDEGAEDYVVG